jgi:hypothetical protein
MGRTLGRPGDRAGQLAVLRAAIKSFETIDKPGGRIDLPFEWIEDKGGHESHEMPPIASYLVRHPWQLPRLINRDVTDIY